MKYFKMYFSHNKCNFHGIRILEREIKCCQLADDTTIFVRDSSEVKNVNDCLNKFSLVSGLNLNKCELFPLKNGQSIDINGIPVKKVFTYLGIKICKDEKESGQLNFQHVLQKNRFNLWLMRDLSINGRIILSKTEGLLYPAISLDVHSNIIKEVDTIFFRFYLEKPISLHQKNDIFTVCNGGLNVLDFSTSNTILKNRWIKHYFQYKNKYNLVFNS